MRARLEKYSGDVVLARLPAAAMLSLLDEVQTYRKRFGPPTSKGFEPRLVGEVLGDMGLMPADPTDERFRDRARSWFVR
jgi:hypothetical protein